MSGEKAADAPDALDEGTARGFAESWNRQTEGSVYSEPQYLDWMAPLDPASFEGKRVLELGFGNGSLLFHTARFRPAKLTGVELGDTIDTTRRNLSHVPPGVLDLVRGDLTTADVGLHDVVYCIGVLHHLGDPDAGVRAVLSHTRPGGSFHCWVYAREGNAVVRALVEPLRRVASRLPWWMTKYVLALPLVLPYFVYAKTLRLLSRAGLGTLVKVLPLSAYSLWIAERSFPFFHHVAFDQLVARRTAYFPKARVLAWLASPDVDPSSVYVIFRNGNSWKFGGRKREAGG